MGADAAVEPAGATGGVGTAVGEKAGEAMVAEGKEVEEKEVDTVGATEEVEMAGAVTAVGRAATEGMGVRGEEECTVPSRRQRAWCGPPRHCSLR